MKIYDIWYENFIRNKTIVSECKIEDDMKYKSEINFFNREVIYVSIKFSYVDNKTDKFEK